MSLVTFLIIGLLGLAVGSFLNVLILRSVHGEKLTGRSHCVHCGHILTPKDLVPLFSYLFLKGQCRYCHKKLSLQYPLVEGANLLLFLTASLLVLNTFKFQLTLPVLFTLGIDLLALSILLALVVTDLRWGLIPNRIIIPGIILLVVVKITYLVTIIIVTYRALAHDSLGLGKYLLPPYSDYLWIIVSRHLQTFGYDLLAGFTIGLVFYLLVLFTRGRAMGGGDIKLGFFVGLLNGWPLSLVTLLLAFTSGALISVLLILIKRKKFGQTVPFGPFLAVSAIITLFWGQEIFDWYINLIG